MRANRTNRRGYCPAVPFEGGFATGGSGSLDSGSSSGAPSSSPFLNSFWACPMDRANFGIWVPPKMTRTTIRMMTSSGAPRPNIRRPTLPVGAPTAYLAAESATANPKAAEASSICSISPIWNGTTPGPTMSVSTPRSRHCAICSAT